MCKQALMKFFKYLMETPEVNSRFAFLLSMGVCCLSITILTIGFLYSPDKSDYPTMVTAIGGVLGVGAVFGRAATKWANSKAQGGKATATDEVGE
jgi:hypothetical protein